MILMAAIDAREYDPVEWLLRLGALVSVEAKGDMTPAYSVQYDLKRFKQGSPSYNKVFHLKALMEADGAVFPALSPEKGREMRGQN